MDDPSGDAPAGPSEGGGGFTGFLSSLRGVIAAIATLIIAVSGLITALRATGVIGGSDEPKAVTSTAPTTTESKRSSYFSPMKRGQTEVYFRGETMHLVVGEANRPLVHLANLVKELRDVSFSARVQGPSGADFGAGFVCRHRSATNYYLLSILSGGRFAVLRYRGGKVTPLKRGESDRIVDGENRVIARCRGHRPTTLSLTVNGRRIARVRDAVGNAVGSVGVRVGTNDPPVRVAFDEVAVDPY